MPGSWVLDQGKDSAGHELRAADRCPAPGHLGHRDHATTGGYLDSSACTRGLNVVRAHIFAGVNDDLYPVTLHVFLNVLTCPDSP
jgi:hypothetical protein